MPDLQEIQREIDKIKTRNKRVEADKAWEISRARKILIGVITYLLIVIFMLVAEIKDPFANALVPTFAYLISMSSLPYFKRMWISKIKR